MPSVMKMMSFLERGILNKLTPEKFQKLSDDLLNIGLNTEILIKGVIILIFDKALDEPKYSSMYAQLCKKLSERVPNFLPTNDPSTFLHLLLNKCRTEFENRSAVQESFEQDGKPLTTEEEERRYVAKCKMLGNIKFAGELAKLEILSHGVVHKCITQLLPDSKRAAEHQEDLECLVQLFKTCGRVLDTKAAKKLMDQYFQQVEKLSQNMELMPRIRFMLTDVIDLRKNGWMPRKAIITEGPVPIQQIRGDDDLHNITARSSELERLRQLGIHNQDSQPCNSLFRSAFKTRPGLVEEWGLSSSLNFLMNQANSNGYGSKNDNKDSYRSHRNQGGYNNYNQRQQGGGGYNKHQNTNNNKDIPPRYKKGLTLPTPGAMEDLRPPANSLLYKPLKPPSFPLHPPQTSLKPTIVERTSNNVNDLMPTPPKAPATVQIVGTSPLLKEPAITIKQVQDKGGKAKKDKGPNREEILKGVSTILDTLTENKQIEDSEDNNPMQTARNAFMELKIPDKILKDIPFTVLNYALEKSEEQSDKCLKFLTGLKEDSIVSSAACAEGIRSVAQVITQREASTPRIGTLVAHLLTNAMQNGLTTLADVASLTENGVHYPLFLLVLQQMNKTLGKQPLTEVFNNSKVNLMSLLPASERTKERLAEILEERGLSFLFPLLRIQAELAKQLQVDPNPNQFYKWIKENLDPLCHTDPGFINALFTVLLKYITQESTLPPGVPVVSPPDKSLVEKERALLDQYTPVLRSFLNDNVQLQLMAIHSLQVYCFSLGFPKGMMLRWFNALYEQAICEEESFFMWKEDITDTFPGKGQALFQVNTWLTWLQEVDSLSDSD